MRLFTVLVFLFGATLTSAYSIPGGYERVLIYYLYSIDCQLNGGTPKKIAPGCKGTGGNPCTLDQLLRYIAKNPNDLPTRSAPATSYPNLPDMVTTANDLTIKDANNKDFAGQITTSHALPGASSDYSKFLAQIGSIAVGFAERSPENANLLKNNIEAIRNTRRMAQMTTFKTANPDLKVATDSIPLYDGAPDNLRVDVINPADTLSQNDGLTMKNLGAKWKANKEGNHAENVDQLKAVLENMEYACA